MTHTVSSGEFCTFINNGGTPQTGLVIETSTNTKADGSADDYVMVVPLDPMLLTGDRVKPIGAAEEEDPNKIVEGKSDAVTGVKAAPKDRSNPGGK